MAFPGLCFDSWSVRLSSMDHFFSDICFFKNHPHTCPSSGLSEKTPGCQKRYWYSLHTPRNRSDAHFFYWFRCIIRFWNSLLSSNNPLLEKVVRADLLIANLSDTGLISNHQVLHALQDFPASQQFLNAKRSRKSIHLKQFELTLREHIIGSWRELDNLTPHDNHHSSRIMRIYHTHFDVPLGIAHGWWNDRKRFHKPMLPLYLRLDISNNFSRALSCLRLSGGHNFSVQRMRHDRNKRSYELRIC